MLSLSKKKYLYRRVNSFYPKLWKLSRLLIFGKIDFNNLNDWENSYSELTEKEILNLQNRIPNLINKAVILTEKYKLNSVLDISAGFGNFLLKLPQTYEKSATEFSNAAIDFLESHGIKTKKAILPNLPFEDESIDVLVSISVFEHLKNRKTIKKSFKECHRVCKNGFIFSVPFKCMEPWYDTDHNFAFEYKGIEYFTKGLFEICDWQVVKDNVTTRSLCYLKKI